MKKNLLVTMILCMALSVTGCAKYEKDESYSTDLYGSYSYSIGSDDAGYIEEWEYIFNKDKTYNYSSKVIQLGEVTRDNSEDGVYSFDEKNSDEIIEIELESETLYKYKNMIGKLYCVETPSKKTFDLIISTPYELMNESYPNAGNIFSEDGIYHSCLDTSKCNCTQDNHTGIYYKYVQKNDMIYVTDPREKNMNYTILFYAVDGGLFSPTVYKNK